MVTLNIHVFIEWIIVLGKKSVESKRCDISKIVASEFLALGL